MSGIQAGVMMVCLAAFCRAGENVQPPEEKSAASEVKAPVAAKAEEGGTMVLIKTSMGDIKVELFDKQAPETVKNFLQYVDAKHYDGTIFHRVISSFMIQGGGFTKDLVQKPTKAPIKNEAKAELKNARGTIAMARTGEINSATTQFFINVVDNGFLDHRDESARGFGYCAFGKVVEGLDVVDKIKAVKTGGRGPFPTDVPLEDVVITSISRVK
jgi:peptidyl-prolyl cis-trans isomerase B (cyclophilin B)